MAAEPFWIEGPWPGRLAIVPRPRGGEWLEDDVSSWVRWGLNAIVSLLTPNEADEFELRNEAVVSGSRGIEFLSFPIRDRSVPSSRGDALELVGILNDRVAVGKVVGIHCRQGVGRSGLIASCVLASSGVPPRAAFDVIGAARGQPVPETDAQREWVESVAPLLVAARKPTGSRAGSDTPPSDALPWTAHGNSARRR